MVRAIMASDDLNSVGRSDEDYATIARRLGSKESVADSRAAAEKYLKARRDKSRMNFATVFGDMQQERIMQSAAGLFDAGLYEGAEIGQAGERAMQKARRAAVAAATHVDYDDVVSDTGLDLVGSIINIPPEKFAPTDEEATEPTISATPDSPAQPTTPTDPDSPENFIGPPTREQADDRAEARAAYIQSEESRRQAEISRITRIFDKLTRRRDERNAFRDMAREFDEGTDKAKSGPPRSSEQEAAAANDETATDPFTIAPEEFRKNHIETETAEDQTLLFAAIADLYCQRNAPEGPTRREERDAMFAKGMRNLLGKYLHDALDPTEGRLLQMLQRKVGEIQNTMPRRSVLTRAEEVLGVAQKAIVRQSKKGILAGIRKDIADFIGRGKEIDRMEVEMGRKILGAYAETAAYIRNIVGMTEDALLQEQQRLEDVINGRKGEIENEEQDVGMAISAATDEVVHRATERLQLLQRFGALRRHGPAEMLRIAAEIREYLESGKAKHEAKWGAYKAQWDGLHDRVLALVNRLDGKTSRRARTGLASGLLDETTATVRQRLERALGGSQEARDLAMELSVMIAEGSQELADLKARYRKQVLDSIRAAVKGSQMSAKDLVVKLGEKVPDDLSRALTRHDNYNGGTTGRDSRLTWGEVGQLYASLLQTATYKDNLAVWGRGAYRYHPDDLTKPERERRRIPQKSQRSIIEEHPETPPELLKLIKNLQSVYRLRRDALSAVMEQVSGFAVYSPDPAYMPVRMDTGATEGTAVEVKAWSPLLSSLTPRRKNNRDFDESRDLLGIATESADDTARQIAWGFRGLGLRSILCRRDVLEAMDKHLGKDSRAALVQQLTDVLTDGYRAANESSTMWKMIGRANNVATLCTLAWNLQSMGKQAVSQSAWAAVLDNGHAGVVSAVSRFSWDAAREFCATPGFRARYGATDFARMFREALADPQSPTAWHRAMQAGMTGLQIADFLPGIMVAAGVYAQRKETLMRRGESEAQARHHAATQTWLLLEESQQSARQENLPPIFRRHGMIGRQLVKYGSSPTLQLSHQIHALRMLLLCRTEGRAEDAKFWTRRLIATTIANNVIVPNAMSLAVILLHCGLLHKDLPDRDEVLGEIVKNIIVGQTSRTLILGSILDSLGTRAAKSMGLKPPQPPGSNIGGAQIPALDFINKAIHTGTMTAADIAALDADNVAEDVLDFLGQALRPVAHIREGAENWGVKEDRRRIRRRRKAQP